MKRASFLFLIGQCLTCWVAAWPQTAPVPIELNIMLEKRIITQHEPAMVDLEFANSSRDDIVVSLGYNNEKLSVTVVDPEGKVHRKPPPVPAGWGNGEAFDVVGQGKYTGSISLTESFTAENALAEWFTFDKVGDYEIEVTLIPNSAPEEHFSYKLISNQAKLNLTVRPRDEASLRLTCGELLSRARDLPYTSPAKWAAARALSGIDDPVAVPFLIDALKEKNFTKLIIPALARLRTDEAIAALGSASKSRDAEVSRMAHSALLSLGR